MTAAQGLAYLGTPYSDYKAGLDAAVAAATRLAGLLTLAGVNLICPVIQGHAIARRMCIDPRDREFWQNLNRPIMARCDRLIVGQLDGWQNSEGLREEIDTFRGSARLVFYCSADALIMHRDGTQPLAFARYLIAGWSRSPDLPPFAHGKDRREHGGSSA